MIPGSPVAGKTEYFDLAADKSAVFKTFHVRIVFGKG